jgi:hypothetical protein
MLKRIALRNLREFRMLAFRTGYFISEQKYKGSRKKHSPNGGEGIDING